jgi:hypothetical protein
MKGTGFLHEIEDHPATIARREAARSSTNALSETKPHSGNNNNLVVSATDWNESHVAKVGLSVNSIIQSSIYPLVGLRDLDGKCKLILSNVLRAFKTSCNRHIKAVPQSN